MKDFTPDIKKLKECDKKAFDKLFCKYAGVVKAIAFRYVQDWQKADDIVQECFIKIYKKIEQYEGRGSFEGWIKRIAVNTALKYVKDLQKSYTLDVDDMQVAEEETEEVNNKNTKSLILNTDFSKEEILEVVASLPTGFRTVFSMYVLDGYQHKEIAEILGISESTSKTQLLRARKLLQKKLFEKAQEKYRHKKLNELNEIIGKKKPNGKK